MDRRFFIAVSLLSFGLTLCQPCSAQKAADKKPADPMAEAKVASRAAR
jgi:hypothetical protein